MEEGENELKRSTTLEKSIKLKDQKIIEELLEKIGDSTISHDMYIKAINTQVSFEIEILKSAKGES